MPSQISWPLKLTRLAFRRMTWTAVYPLLIKYLCPYRKERIGQGPPRPRLYTDSPTSPDPRGLRDGNPAWPSVQRHDGFVGDADLRTSPMRRGRRQERPLHTRHSPRERDLRPQRPARGSGRRRDPLRGHERRVPRQAPGHPLRPYAGGLAFPPRLPGLPRLQGHRQGPRGGPHRGRRRGHGKRHPGRELSPDLRPWRVRRGPQVDGLEAAYDPTAPGILYGIEPIHNQEACYGCDSTEDRHKAIYGRLLPVLQPGEKRAGAARARIRGR